MDRVVKPFDFERFLVSKLGQIQIFLAHDFLQVVLSFQAYFGKSKEGIF